LHRQFETHVGHDRRYDGVVGQPTTIAQSHGQYRQDVIAIYYGTIGGNRQAPVGIAVVGESDIGTGLPYLVDQAFKVGGPALRVDVPAIGGIVDRLHLGAG